MKLYYHKTDGGAEYLCTSPVKGTDEGDLYTAVIRLDGGAEFTNPVYATAPELLKALEISLHEINELKRALANHVGGYAASVYYQFGNEARAVISKATGDN